MTTKNLISDVNAQAFAAVCLTQADRVEASGLNAALTVAAAAFAAGGTNKAALRALFATLPEGLAKRQSQAHRILGGLVRQSADITDTGTALRALILPTKGKTTAQAVKAAQVFCSNAGIASARALLDAVAPRTEKKPVEKTPVERFLSAYQADKNGVGDLTPLLVALVTDHQQALVSLLGDSIAQQVGRLKDATDAAQAAQAMAEKAAQALSVAKAAKADKADKAAKAVVVEKLAGTA